MFIKEKLIDPKTAQDMLNISGILAWIKCKPIIEDLRIRYNYQDYMAGFEYLYNETMKLVPDFTVPIDLMEEELTRL